jgi:ketohexokinase
MPESTISVEVEKPGREGLIGLAAEADVVFYSKSWAEVSRPRNLRKIGD